MLIEIDFNSEVPIYIQLRDQIARGIATGAFAPGDDLPSVRQMGSDLGINMHTVGKTYALLKDEGLILIDRRRGVRVNRIPEQADDIYLEHLQKQIEDQAALAWCKGVTEQQYCQLCKKAFNLYSKGDPNHEHDHL